MTRRVVVTGISLISPLGIGTGPTWDGLVAGRSGVSTITRFDTTDFAVKIAGEVEGFEPTDWIEHKEVKKFDLFVHYALAASLMALE
ncbi:MAG: beta-ketoacyl-[acyl-carrier-protein] synthase II, partial [Acidobacteria bacterium]|nr:beta-ketoacyl-[acyl-carrier-protein] synthase II [Acidobacteriota bacterium]